MSKRRKTSERRFDLVNVRDFFDEDEKTIK